MKPIIIKNVLILIVAALLFCNNCVIGRDDPESHKINDSLQIDRWSTSFRNLVFVNSDSAKAYVDSIFVFSGKNKNAYGIYQAYSAMGFWHWVKYQTDSAISYYHKAYRAATEGGLTRQQISSLSNIALTYKIRLNTDSALFYFDKTIDLARKYDIKDILARTLINQNFMFTHNGRYIDAANTLFEAKKIGEELANHTIISLTYSALGLLYANLENSDQAIRCNKLAIHHDTLENEIYSLPSVYLNLAESYIRDNRNPDSARYFLAKVKETSRPSEQEIYNHAVSANLGTLHFNLKNYDSSFYYCQKTYNDPFNTKNPARTAGTTTNLGTIYYMRGDYDNAGKYLSKGYHLADSLKQADVKVIALFWMIRIDSVLGNFKQAYTKMKNYHALKEKMQKNSAQIALLELEINRQLQMAEYQNKVLVQENELKSTKISNQRTFIFISLLVLAGVVSFTIIQLRNRKKINSLNMSLVSRQQELESVNTTLIAKNDLLQTQQKWLEELNQSKDKFISIMGHDLKTPFNGLLGMLDFLLQDWDLTDDKEKQKLLSAVFQSSSRTYELLENLLNWGKSQQGLIKYNESEVSVDEVTTTIRYLFQGALEKKSITLETHTEPGMKLLTDERLLKQVIQNFTGNAIKYTHRGGKITIEAGRDSGRNYISVTDSGIGIPADKIDTLFDLNANFGRPGTEQEISTGMGLILCREYARIMNADLSVTSVAGQGSTFTIFFPHRNG